MCVHQDGEAPPGLRWRHRPNIRHVCWWFLQAAAAAVRAEMDAAEERMEAELKAAQDEAHRAAEQQQAAVAARCTFTLSSDTHFKQPASQTLCFSDVV